MQFFKGISIVLLSFYFFGCNFIDTKKVSYEEIQLASTWSENDQPPSFEQCDVLLDLYDQKKCFEENLLNMIYSGLVSLKVQSSEPFYSEIIVVIKIDENGLFSIDRFDDSDEVFNKVTNLEKQITKIVKNLPKALPAIKTNVGSYVNVKFTLPIKIKASILE